MMPTNYLIIILTLLQGYNIAILSEKLSHTNTENSKANAKQVVMSTLFPGGGCPCSLAFPPCCTPEFAAYSCDCAPPPMCGACNNYVNVHDNMLKLAMKDAYNQQDLAHKAKLQVELFQKAQEYAKEVGFQEMKAKQFANNLNEVTRKAQFTRAMMFQVAAQIRNLADQTIRSIQPLRCFGPKCGAPMMTSMIPTYSTPMMFKQKDNNLRGS